MGEDVPVLKTGKIITRQTIPENKYNNNATDSLLEAWTPGARCKKQSSGTMYANGDGWKSERRLEVGRPCRPTRPDTNLNHGRARQAAVAASSDPGQRLDWPGLWIMVAGGKGYLVR